MKTIITLALAAVLVLSPTVALANDSESENKLSVKEMLQWAIQDEVSAEATYQAILNKFGQNMRPFSSIVKAEQTHQSLLKPLMEQYGVTTPAAEEVTLPESFQEALEMGVMGEIENIKIYKKFLEQGSLPDDVKVVFERLMHASENHLAAFSRSENGRGNGQNPSSKEDSRNSFQAQNLSKNNPPENLCNLGRRSHPGNSSQYFQRNSNCIYQ